ELQDFSPTYWEAVADRTRDMIADVDAFDDGSDDSDDEDDFDEVDHVTAAVLRDRLCLDLDLHHHGEDLAQLNNIASPVQTIRDTLLLMPTDTPEQIDALRSRLSKVPAALAGYRESLAEAASHGHVAPVRQVDEVYSQCQDLVESPSLLEQIGLPKDAPEVETAKQAFADMADWLSEQLATHAPKEDAVGRERYQRFSHLFVGDSVDLDEAYTWGLERLREIDAEQQAIARKLYDTDDIRLAYRRLND